MSRRWDRVARDATRSASRATTSRSCLTSEVSVWVLAIAEIVGVATFISLWAMSASLVRSMEASVEARTVRTFGGRRCRKSSRRKVLASADAPSLSPRSCYMRRSSCVGLRSPSSSPLMSCCSLCCSEAAVRLINSAVRVL